MSEPPQAKGILCFDFDGTLIDHEADPMVNPLFFELLKEFRRDGVVWAINTGRTLFQTIQGLNEIGVDPLPDYLMVKERELYHLGPYNRWVDYGDWNRECFKQHKRFMKSQKRFFKKIRNYIETSTDAAFTEFENEPPGILARDDDEMAEICLVIDQERVVDPVIDYQRNTRYLRFSHADYHKGSVLGELARLLSVDSQHIVVAGDNFNDLPMLDPKFANHLICPDNALDEVKDHVKERGGFISSKRASHGVIEGLQRLELR